MINHISSIDDLQSTTTTKKYGNFVLCMYGNLAVGTGVWTRRACRASQSHAVPI